jgi:hypothetical protein
MRLRLERERQELQQVKPLLARSLRHLERLTEQVLPGGNQDGKRRLLEGQE